MEVENKVYKIITGIEIILGMISTVNDIFAKGQKQLSYLTIFLLVFGALFILSLILTSYPVYSFKKWFFWFLNTFDPQPYIIELHEVSYVYHDSCKLDYHVSSSIKTLESGVSVYAGRVRWTKELKANDYKRILQLHDSCKNNMTLIGRWKHPWWEYLVWFDEQKKGESIVIKTDMMNLEDPNKESEPYLTKNILKRINKLKQSVTFDSNNMPKKIYYEIFKGNSSVPTIKEVYDLSGNNNNKRTISHIQYDINTKTATAVINKPIQGYRYRLHWEF